MGYKYVELEGCPRKYAYEKFINAANPMMTMTTKVDITKLYKASKKEHKLNALLMYALMKSAEINENFYYDLKDKKLIIYDKLCCNLVIKGSDGELYYVSIPSFDNYLDFEKEYIRLTSKYYNECKHYNIEDAGLVATSAVVNSTFESIVSGYTEDFVNNFFTWGKYEKKWNKVTLNISIRFHHAFLDGMDVGKYFNDLRNFIGKFKI